MMPYFSFHVRDWLSSSSVQALTYAEQGVYITLLAKMWEQAPTHGDCSLPDDDRFLARTLHLSPEEWAEFRSVLVDGPQAVLRSEGGRIFNPRLRSEWEAACRKSKQASEAIGKRWDNARNADVERSNKDRNTEVEQETYARNTDVERSYYQSEAEAEYSVPPAPVANATSASGTGGVAQCAPAADPPQPPKARERKPPDPRIKPVLDYFGERFRAEMGRTYPAVFGRDAAQIRSLPKDYDTDTLCALVDEFFASDDPEVRRGTPTVANFVRLVPRLVALSNGRARASPRFDPYAAMREVFTLATPEVIDVGAEVPDTS
jgi:uncharacterized protein YdaU (DUF1376 family)